jgi:hypothetical protein
VLRICHEVKLLIAFIVFRWIEIVSYFNVAILAVLNDVVDGHQQVGNVFFVVDVERRESYEREIFNEIANGFGETAMFSSPR